MAQRHKGKQTVAKGKPEPFFTDTKFLFALIAALLIINGYFYSQLGEKTSEMELTRKSLDKANAGYQQSLAELSSVKADCSKNAARADSLSENLTVVSGMFLSCEEVLLGYPTQPYANHDFEFTMGYPQNWVYFENVKWANVNDSSIVYFLMQSNSAFPARVIVDSNKTSRTLDEEVAAMQGRYDDKNRNPFANFNMLSQGKIRLNNMDAYAFLFEYNEPGFANKLTRAQYVFVKEGYAFRMDSLAESDAYQKLSGTLNGIVGSIRFAS